MDDERIENLEQRVSSLEEWRHQQDINTAVRLEQSKHIDRRFTALEEQMGKGFGKIDSHISKIVWIVISSLLMAVVAYALKGGFNIVG